MKLTFLFQICLMFKKIEEDRNMMKREMIDIRDIKMELS